MFLFIIFISVEYVFKYNPGIPVIISLSLVHCEYVKQSNRVLKLKEGIFFLIFFFKRCLIYIFFPTLNFLFFYWGITD